MQNYPFEASDSERAGPMCHGNFNTPIVPFHFAAHNMGIVVDSSSSSVMPLNSTALRVEPFLALPSIGHGLNMGTKQFNFQQPSARSPATEPMQSARGSQPPARQARLRYSNAEWEHHKPTIGQLYLRENRPLNEVIGIMTAKYGFNAT